jgi:UDP-N-acetylmuramate--alanine ligase
MKIQVGIIFGGRSKEREISFAGGRTVYDNLNKSLFDAVPLFIDSFNNFILLNWEFIYKGSIRDFYPAPDSIPTSPNEFQIYAESLGNLSLEEQETLIQKMGQRIPAEELKSIMDIGFLCLHGPYGEDGRIQGLLEYLDIPYTGSGILSSAIGINKTIQKQLMSQAGFNNPPYFTVDRIEWLANRDSNQILNRVGDLIGFPCVIKAPTQGSSIGVNVLSVSDAVLLSEAIDKSLFIRRISAYDWHKMEAPEQVEYIRTLCDIREGIGIPLKLEQEIYYHPDHLLKAVNALLENAREKTILLESLDGESEVIIEGFIEGKEFSSIVIQDLDGTPICLPPTEIRKGKEVFDYRSKYLPGLSRKITPIQIPDEQIEAIRQSCERLFTQLGFGVYARIDGFITADGKVFLNDPNTTSGMMPSSFFFHQAAEIGFNPSQFITYIIYTSLKKRRQEFKFNGTADHILSRLETDLSQIQAKSIQRKRIAVVFGGYSSERHISVESGRNVYEKLSSSSVFEPLPLFLSGNDAHHTLYTLPISLMLKDNADDILDKIKHFSIHPVVSKIIAQCHVLTEKFGDTRNLNAPQEIGYPELAARVEEVFIALHGRPGEDGAFQRQLQKIGLPFNGSDAESSAITIDKFRTNELLKANGLLVAEHFVVSEESWNLNPDEVLEKANNLGYPLIVKPVDDGCSSAVKKIKSNQELRAFAKLIFRKEEQFDPEASSILNIKPKEEFPMKRQFLVESLITANGAETFLEITGGMLTHLNRDGDIRFEVFEASEALSEGEVLSLEEKFLAGQGQNITPARYSKGPSRRQEISEYVKKELEKAARILQVRGYCRIDAFVRIYNSGKIEVIFIEVNSLPGMTPATCIFHQSAINGYKPYDFIEKIMTFAEATVSPKSQPA